MTRPTHCTRPRKPLTYAPFFSRNIKPMTNPPPYSRPRNAIANIIFASRWLQLPIYLGLIVVQLIYSHPPKVSDKARRRRQYAVVR